MDRRTLLSLVPAAFAAMHLPVRAQEVLPVYNLVGSYMNWNVLADAYSKAAGVRPTIGLKPGSGAALAAMRLEANRPQASAAFWSLDIAMDAKATGVTSPYQPKGIDIVPSHLKDPEGHWWTIASTNVVIGVNEQILARRGLAKPTSYADLLKPEYAGLIAAMDPTWSGTASVFMYGINFALGGTQTDFRPGMRWLKAFTDNKNEFRAELVAPRLAAGDIAISLDTEGGILTAKSAGAPVSIVIPSEGVIGVPVGMSMGKNGPKRQEAEAFMDWLLSEHGQQLIAQAYFRPMRVDAVPESISQIMPPVPNVIALDIAHQAKVVTALKRAFTESVVRGADVEQTLGRYNLAG